SSYYNQNGNNAAVTGGIGSEKLTDFSEIIDFKWARQDKKKRFQTLSFNLGIDSYTSASSDKIDPATISSASSKEKRFYPTLTYALKNKEKRYQINFIGYYSKEYDYNSIGPGVQFLKFSKNNNRELSVKFQTYFDNRKIILP